MCRQCVVAALGALGPAPGWFMIGWIQGCGQHAMGRKQRCVALRFESQESRCHSSLVPQSPAAKVLLRQELGISDHSTSP